MFLHKITADIHYWQRYNSEYLRNGYFIHQQIWNLVRQNPLQTRDFIFHIEYDAYKNVKHILLLSPNIIRSNSTFSVSYVEYNPLLSQTEEFRFKLRANPIVKRKINNKQKEFNIIINAIEEQKQQGIYLLDTSLDEFIYDVGMEWLIRKGKQHGFTVKHREISIGDRLEYQIKANTKPEFVIRTLDFDGILEVTDPELFKTTLFKGIGSAKAFGCGLLLIKRV